MKSLAVRKADREARKEPVGLTDENSVYIRSDETLPDMLRHAAEIDHSVAVSSADELAVQRASGILKAHQAKAEAKAKLHAASAAVDAVKAEGAEPTAAMKQGAQPDDAANAKQIDPKVVKKPKKRKKKPLHKKRGNGQGWTKQ